MVPFGLVALVERRATDETQPRRIRRDTERERVFLLSCTHREWQWIHQDLVRRRSVRCQHLGAPDDQAVGGLFHYAEMRVGIGLLGGGFAAIDLRIDDRMGEKKVIVAAETIVPLDVVGELTTTFPEEVRR